MTHSTLRCIPKRTKTYFHIKTCAQMFTAGLFIMSKKWKQPTHPPTDESVVYMGIVNPYGEYPYGEILVSHKNEWRTDTHYSIDRASLLAQTVKNPPAINAGDLGLIPGLGRSLGGRAWQCTPVFLPGEFPWAEEPGGLQSVGSQRIGHN